MKRGRETGTNGSGQEVREPTQTLKEIRKETENGEGSKELETATDRM